MSGTHGVEVTIGNNLLASKYQRLRYCYALWCRSIWIIICLIYVWKLNVFQHFRVHLSLLNKQFIHPSSDGLKCLQIRLVMD